MKFKFLTILMAIAIVLSFTSCDNKKASASSSTSESSESSESISKQVDENNKDEADAPHPTGDTKNDLKAYIDYLQKVDVKNPFAVRDAIKMMNEFTKYYEADAELKAKWEDALIRDPNALKILGKFLEEAEKESKSSK